MASPLILALAVSLDSLGVGLAYGMRKVRIPLSSYLIIAVCTALLMGISMSAGKTILSFIGPSLARVIGGLILIAIGVWQLRQGWRNYLNSVVKEDGRSPNEPIADFRIKPLGIAVQILRDPATADFDGSGDIETKEAYALGIALGLDAFGAGFGAAMTGFALSIIPVISLASVLLVAAGNILGKVSPADWWTRKGFVFPGVLLILIGLMRL